jgi:hypothetical protein
MSLGQVRELSDCTTYKYDTRFESQTYLSSPHDLRRNPGLFTIEEETPFLSVSFSPSPDIRVISRTSVPADEDIGM